ncbi:MAG: DUF1298 domain-containing protein [Acidimicrobiales bacterium]|nr:DUF1298 domain-containing protein [Acidimicrobiales bacterium]
MERFRGIDAAFLHLDTDSTRWAVLAVVVLDPTDAPEPVDTRTLKRLFADRMARMAPLRRRMVHLPWLPSRPLWVDDSVDVDVQMRTVHLQLDDPRSGDARPLDDGFAGGASDHDLDDLAALARLAAEEAERPLPLDRPLWDAVVVEGLRHGRVGLIMKVHHAITDGASALGLLATLVDAEPVAPPAEPPARPAPPATGPLDVLAAMAADLVRRPAVVARSLASAAFAIERVIQHVAGPHHVTLPLTAPPTPLSRAITPQREVALATVPVADVLAVKLATGATFTDVLAAIVTGALRRWLADAGALPDTPLLATIPALATTDIEGLDGPEPGNRLSVLFAPLPTDEADPRRRIELLRERLHAGRLLRNDLGPLLAALAELAPWRLVSPAFRAFSGLDGADHAPPVASVLLTTLSGPTTPLYMAGARIVGLFPLGPIFDGIALNLTVMSREDDVEIGLLGCPDVTPPLAALTAAFPPAVAELVAATAGPLPA